MPVDFTLAAKLAYWTASEGAAYLLGVEPREIAIRNQGNWRVYDKHSELLTLIHRAIEVRQLSAINSPAGYKLLPREFVAWASRNSLQFPPALLAAMDRSKSQEPTETLADSPETATGSTCASPRAEGEASLGEGPSGMGPANAPIFDPLPLDGIARIFKLASDENANLKLWRNLAKSAIRNGLAQAREGTGRGTRQSTYEPERVGDWLVGSGKMDRALVNRALRANLPPRSSDLREFYAQ